MSAGVRNMGHANDGSASTWPGHLELINIVVQHGYDTALIVEDDVDWDVAIRDQMRRISDAVRNSTNTSAHDLAPYGRGWDVLWIGHCGDYFEEVVDVPTFSDPSVIPQFRYRGWARAWAQLLPPNHRAIFQSKNPTCTTAYAISRLGARKVLRLAGDRPGQADNSLLRHGCKDGVLKCLTVFPEIMREYLLPTGQGYLAQVDLASDMMKLPGLELSDRLVGTADNIVDSSRRLLARMRKTPASNP